MLKVWGFMKRWRSGSNHFVPSCLWYSFDIRSQRKCQPGYRLREVKDVRRMRTQIYDEYHLWRQTNAFANWIVLQPFMWFPRNIDVFLLAAKESSNALDKLSSCKPKSQVARHHDAVEMPSNFILNAKYSHTSHMCLKSNLKNSLANFRIITIFFFSTRLAFSQHVLRRYRPAISGSLGVENVCSEIQSIIIIDSMKRGERFKQIAFKNTS